MKLKAQHIVLGVVLVGALGYLLMPSDTSFFSTEEEIASTPQFESPKPVAVSDFVNDNKVEIPKLTEKEIHLSNLEFRLREAQLNAAISDAVDKSRKSGRDDEKELAEIEKIKAETERARLDVSRGVNNQVPSPMFPTMIPTPSPIPTPAIVAPAPAVKDASSGQDNRVILNRVMDGRATVTVGRDIGTIGVGETFNGIKLISISANRESVVAQNMRTKKTQTYSLTTSSTRIFSQVEPIGSKESGEPKKGISNQPSQIPFDRMNGGSL